MREIQTDTYHQHTHLSSTSQVNCKKKHTDVSKSSKGSCNQFQLKRPGSGQRLAIDSLPGDQLIFLSLGSPLRAAREGWVSSSELPGSTDILQ